MTEERRIVLNLLKQKEIEKRKKQIEELGLFKNQNIAVMIDTRIKKEQDLQRIDNIIYKVFTSLIDFINNKLNSNLQNNFIL